MGTPRDAISRIAVFDPLSDLTLTFGSAFDLTSDSVDTKGMYGLGFICTGDRAVAAADDLNFSFEESDDDTNWSAVPAEGSLPTRKQPPNNDLVIEAGGFQQVIGVFSTKRYVRVRMEGQADTSDFVLTLTPFALSNEEEFTGYDPASVPGDGLP